MIIEPFRCMTIIKAVKEEKIIVIKCDMFSAFFGLISNRNKTSYAYNENWSPFNRQGKARI